MLIVTAKHWQCDMHVFFMCYFLLLWWGVTFYCEAGKEEAEYQDCFILYACYKWNVADAESSCCVIYSYPHWYSHSRLTRRIPIWKVDVYKMKMNNKKYVKKEKKNSLCRITPYFPRSRNGTCDFVVKSPIDESPK